MSFSKSRLSHPKYRPDIDGLRAVAVLAVVAFHSFPDWIKGGFIGVDVFFVISGYLISTIIFENLDRGTFSFTEFYARRIKRIFPALIIVLVACFLIGWFVLLADEYKQLVKHIAAGSGFISNIILWNEAGYFDNLSGTKPLLHLWSLGIEEQFYIVWPLLLWLVWKNKFNLLTSTIIVATVSFILNIKGVKHDSVATYYSPQTRFWELLCGSILAWMMLYKKDYLAFIMNKMDGYLSYIVYREKQVADGKTISNTLSLAGILLLTYGFWCINQEQLFPGKLALVPVFGAVLMILSGSKAWINRVILSNKVAVWCGLISFPLYLWHWPLLSFARIVEGEVPGPNIRIVTVILSFLLAWLTYKLIESPVRIRWHSKYKTAILFALMTSIGVFAYISYLSNIIPPGAAMAIKDSKQLGWEIPVGTNKQIALGRKLCPERSQMTSQERDDNFCYLQKDSTPNVLLVGDSMNLSLFPGLIKYDDYNILLLSASAAAPLYNVRTTEFNDTIRQNNFKLTNQALDYALSHDNIKVVVLSSIMLPAITEPKSPFKITDVTTPQNLDARNIFSASLSFTIKKLLEKNKSIIYVLPYPTLSYDIKSGLKSYRKFSLSNTYSKSCSEPAIEHINRTKKYKEWVMSVLKDFPQVKVFDAALPFCNANYCYGIKDGQILYRDGGHLSISGSNLVAPFLHDLIIKSLLAQ